MMINSEAPRFTQQGCVGRRANHGRRPVEFVARRRSTKPNESWQVNAAPYAAVCWVGVVNEPQPTTGSFWSPRGRVLTPAILWMHRRAGI